MAKISFVVDSMAPSNTVPGLEAAWKTFESNSNEVLPLKELVEKHVGGEVELSVATDGKLIIAIDDEGGLGMSQGLDAIQTLFTLRRGAATATAPLGGAGVASHMNVVIEEPPSDRTIKVILNAFIPSQNESGGAKEWIVGLVDNDAKGHIGKTVPLNNGRVLVIDVNKVTNHAFDTKVKVKLEAVGKVELLSTDEIADRKGKNKELAEKRGDQAKQVGNLDRTMSLLDRLATMRGDGGNDAKRRKFVDRSLTIG